jgi:hypothetical protein
MDATSDPVPEQGTSDSAAAISQVVAQLVRAAPQAVETLRRNLDCGRPSEELKAASFLLAHVEGGLALMDQLARLEAMSQTIEGLKNLILEGQQSGAAARATGRGTNGDEQLQPPTVTNGD